MTVIWVTGAHGFIGRHVAAEAARGGACVAGIGHGTWTDDEAAGWGVSTWHQASIVDDDLDRLAVRTGRPALVYHVAGGSSVGGSFAAPKADFHRTVTATAELLDWLRREAPQAQLVVASSAAVYGSRLDARLAEDMPLSPYSPYGHHKLIMEQLCRSAGANFATRSAIIRLFSVYGEGLTKQLLWDLGTRMSAGPDAILLGGTGDELRDWTHVADIARLMVRGAALAATDVPVINGGRGIAVSVREIAELFRQGWGKDAPPIRFSGIGRSGDPHALVADPMRLDASDFTWSIAAEDGIPAYARWFRAQVDHR